MNNNCINNQEDNYDSTKNIGFEERPQYFLIENNLDIFSDIDVENIKNNCVQTNVKNFIEKFKSIILNYNENINNGKMENPLPKIVSSANEDESLLLEWIFKDFRAMFSFEPVAEESYWSFLSNKNIGDVNISGNLNIKNIDDIIAKTITLAFQNT